MRRTVYLLVLFISVVKTMSAQSACNNVDFELSTVGQYTTANAVSGWTVTSQANTNANNCGFSAGTWTAGSPQFQVVQTPVSGLSSIGTLSHSPLGGTKVVRLNNPQIVPIQFNVTNLRTKISRTFSVTASNTLFRFAFAGQYSNDYHSCCDQPLFALRLLDCNQATLSCYAYSLQPAASLCTMVPMSYSVTNAQGILIYYTGWKVQEVDLTPFIGSCVTVEAMSSGCAAGSHAGMTFFDATCGAQPNIGSSFCVGSSSVQLSAPLGYTSYAWVVPQSSPSLSAQQASLSAITVSNPIPGSTYTVSLTNISGCQFTAHMVLSPVSLSLVSVSASPSCTDVAMGSASVQAAGSNNSYTYLWTAIGNGSVVGTGSVVGNLLPGVYSVNVVPTGSLPCGASATVMVWPLPPHWINVVASPTLICAGDPVSLYATSSAGTFTWINLGTSSIYTVNPLASTVFTVAAPADSVMCASTETVAVQVFVPPLLVTSSAASVCSGGNVTLTATGATSYMWSNFASGSVNVVSPPATDIFTVTATSTSLSLQCSESKTIQVTVVPVPTVTAGSTFTTICEGSTATLIAGGAQTYTWNTGILGPVVSVMPPNLGNYAFQVIGTNPAGCTDSAVVLLNVNQCTGLIGDEGEPAQFKVYPNPSYGEFLIAGNRDMKLEILDARGALVVKVNLRKENGNRVILSGLSEGLYVLRETDNVFVKKILVMK
jgi:hypothetical protein